MDQNTQDGPERHLGGAPRGAQPTRARLGPQVRPGGLCPPRWASRTPYLHYKLPNILKPSGVTLDQKFRHRKAL